MNWACGAGSVRFVGELDEIQTPAEQGTTAHTNATPPHLHRDWAHPYHVRTGTGRTLTTSAPGLGSPLPYRARQELATSATSSLWSDRLLACVKRLVVPLFCIVARLSLLKSDPRANQARWWCGARALW